MILLGLEKLNLTGLQKTVDHTFELADQLSRNMDLIEESAGIDTAHIHDLIRSHEECQEHCVLLRFAVSMKCSHCPKTSIISSVKQFLLALENLNINLFPSPEFI